MFVFRTLALAISAFGATQAVAECGLFEHRDYGGAEYWLGHMERMKMVNGESVGCSGPSCENVYFEPAWNDAVSSFRVEAGCTLSLWEHVGPAGARFRSSDSYNYVGGDWNDLASEALCVCN